MIDAPVRSPVGPPAAPHSSSGVPGRTVPVLLAAGGIAAGCAALFASRLVGTTAAPEIAGLPDAGDFTRLALPLAKTAYDVAAVGVLGTLVLAILLLPQGRPDLAASVDAAMRSAARWATCWAVSSVVFLLLTLSDVVARPLPKVLTPELLGQFSYSFGPTRALMSSAFLAVLVAVAARSQPTQGTRILCLALAVGALLPPLLTGHSSHARYQALALTSISVHVVAASVWVGGLLALLVGLRGSGGALIAALPRFSRVALVCCLSVGISGVLNGWVRLGAAAELWTTSYGRLMVAKTVALLVLAIFGWWHRRRTIAALVDHRPRAFVLLAATELVVMLLTVGLAVALARTPPPPTADHPEARAAASAPLLV